MIILSGGMDSTTLLYYLCQNEKPDAIIFRYGQKHSKEIEYAKYHAKKLGVRYDIVNLSFPLVSALVSSEIVIPNIETVMGDPQPPTYVPNRNMIFLSIAVGIAESRGKSKVYYGAQRHDIYGYWDTTPQFLQKINDILCLNRKNNIEICAPFINYSKSDIVKIGKQLGVDYGKTWSCYRGGESHCGTCPTCAERIKALEDGN